MAALSWSSSAEGLRWRLRRVLWRAGYLAWRSWHPLGSFAQYYVEQASDRLARGVRHPTLGAQSTGDAVALETVAWLRRAGMVESSTVVDYGCGSLRLGRHLIQFLDRGRYWGLDVTDRFYLDAVPTLDPGVVASKQPHFDVISRRALRPLVTAPPDIVLVFAVLHHVPPHRLPSVAENIASIMGPLTVGHVWFTAGAETRPIGPLTFLHQEEAVARTFKELGLLWEVLARGETGPGGKRAMAQVRLSRPAR